MKKHEFEMTQPELKQLRRNGYRPTEEHRLSSAFEKRVGRTTFVTLKALDGWYTEAWVKSRLDGETTFMKSNISRTLNGALAFAQAYLKQQKEGK